MLNRILWATDGSKDSFVALTYAELLAKNCKADIRGLTVLPEDYKFFDTFPLEEKKKFKSSIKATLELKERKRLEAVKKRLKQNDLPFSYSIAKGIASMEIITAAECENVDLIAMGKGRSVDKFILGGTVLKVLRNCTIPILAARENGMRTAIKKILVPVALSHGITANFDYALKLSETFNSEIHLANIVETSEHKFIPGLVGKIKSHTKREMRYMLKKSNTTENIRVDVEAAKNAWIGITELARKNDIDLIVMMTYGGTVFKEDFIGSITWKVIQESSVPVITLTPSKVILKMTGDAK